MSKEHSSHAILGIRSGRGIVHATLDVFIVCWLFIKLSCFGALELLSTDQRL